MSGFQIKPDHTAGWREATFTIPRNAPAGSQIMLTELPDDDHVEIWLMTPAGEQTLIGRASSATPR